MSAADPVRLVRPADRVEGERTPGMTREQAIAWTACGAGLVRTEAHMITGWHPTPTTTHPSTWSTVPSGWNQDRAAAMWSRRPRATSCMCQRARSIERATPAGRKATSS